MILCIAKGIIGNAKVKHMHGYNTLFTYSEYLYSKTLCNNIILIGWFIVIMTRLTQNTDMGEAPNFSTIHEIGFIDDMMILLAI